MKLTRLQRILLILAAALAISLAATFRRVPRPARESAPSSASAQGPAGAGQPTTLLSGFDYSESSAGKTRFTVHADRTVGFAQGAGLPSTWYRLERVALTLYSENAQPLSIRSDSADYDPRTKAMNLTGHVVARDVQGTEVRSAIVQFDPNRRQLTIPGVIQFFRGAISGRAASATYGTENRVLLMAGPITASGAGPYAPFDTIRADAGEYRAADAKMTFTGHVQGSRSTDTLACDRVVLHLTPDDRVDSAVASGDVAGTITSGGAHEDYSAAEARSTFGVGGKVSQVVLSGTPATIVAPAQPTQPVRKLIAPRILLGFADGRLSTADAQGRPRLERTVPGNSGEPFDESITSDTAHAVIAPDGALSTAQFDGEVVGVTSEGRSRSPSALYSADTDVTVLSAIGEQDAELDAARGKVVARKIEIDGKSGVITATGEARAFLRPGSGNASMPSFVASSKQPTRGKARRIVLDDRRRTATFTGDAALWQEENALLADAIELRDADKTARAEGHVRLSGRSAAARAASVEKTSVTASKMHYDDMAKTAVFEDSVIATRDAQTAKGDRAEVRFDSDNRVERTVLDGHVTFEDRATGRHGAGTRVVDEPKAGVTNLAGDPAVAHDGQGSRVEGAVLTFRKESGSVEVKAKAGGRIESIYQTHGR
jgi:lipopolysaccharide transport protein LptA